MDNQTPCTVSEQNLMGKKKRFLGINNILALPCVDSRAGWICFWTNDQHQLLPN